MKSKPQNMNLNIEIGQTEWWHEANADSKGLGDSAQLFSLSRTFDVSTDYIKAQEKPQI